MTLIPQTRRDNVHGGLRVLGEHCFSSCQMRTCLCDHSAGFAAVVLQSREAENEVSDSGPSDYLLAIFQQQEPAPAAAACSGMISASSGKAAKADLNRLLLHVLHSIGGFCHPRIECYHPWMEEISMDSKNPHTVIP